MVILPAKFSEYSTGSLFMNLTLGSTHSKNTSNGTTINHGKCTGNMMQNMNDMQDMICDAYACSGRKMMNMAVTWQTKHATGKMR